MRRVQRCNRRETRSEGDRYFSVGNHEILSSSVLHVGTVLRKAVEQFSRLGHYRVRPAGIPLRAGATTSEQRKICGCRLSRERFTPFRLLRSQPLLVCGIDLGCNCDNRVVDVRIAAQLRFETEYRYSFGGVPSGVSLPGSRAGEFEALADSVIDWPSYIIV